MMPKKTYVNQYHIKDDCCQLRIFGGKYEAIIEFDRCDLAILSSVDWSLANVGRGENKRIYPVTIIDRKSVNLARWLLNVQDSMMRVEHYDRDQFNCRRSNLYVIHRSDCRIRASRDSIPTGVFEIHQKNGELAGYTVYDFVKQMMVYFSAKHYGGQEHALEAATHFRQSMLSLRAQHNIA